MRQNTLIKDVLRGYVATTQSVISTIFDFRTATSCQKQPMLD